MQPNLDFNWRTDSEQNFFATFGVLFVLFGCLVFMCFVFVFFLKQDQFPSVVSSIITESSADIPEQAKDLNQYFCQRQTFTVSQGAC